MDMLTGKSYACKMSLQSRMVLTGPAILQRTKEAYQ